MKRSLKISFFGKATESGFGLTNMSHGMYSGGYERYLFGIRFLFNIEYIRSWGGFA